MRFTNQMAKSFALLLQIIGLPLVAPFTVVHHSNQRLPNIAVKSAATTCSNPLEQRPRNLLLPGSSVLVLFESKDGGEHVEAEDLPAIQALFSKHCDKDGLMTKSALETSPPFADMLADEDLLMEELNDVWDAAPKFPDVTGEDTRIDVDSFVQIYRDVDDLFEEDEEGNKKTTEAKSTESEPVAAEEPEPVGADAAEDETVEAELERVFETVCDKDGLVSKASLKEWEEIEKLLTEGLLGDDEFDELWDKTQKSPGSSDQLDVDGFLSFNVGLDGLFDFDDDELEDDDEDESVERQESAEVQVARQIVEGGDLPPGVLFSAIADEDYLVGMDELKLWSELQDMLDEGDLLPSELQNIYDGIDKPESGKLDEDGFSKLYEEVDKLFEDDDDDSEPESAEAQAQQMAQQTRVKADLLSFLDIIIDDEDGLPCGLDCTEKDQKQLLNIVSALEEQPGNWIKNKNIEMKDLVGTWVLLYSSSAAMKFNQGLSGLGGSVPNGKSIGVTQKLEATKYMSDVEYIERIEVTPSSASFDVSVTGSWDLRTSVSLFTGQPSIVMNVEPDRVKYGPTSTRADHWKSLGPMNMLDLTYLDDDFRVLRGCTSSDSVFLYKRTS